MDFSLPALRQMVTSLAWPSSWRWVRLPAKGGASKEVEASRESEERGEDGIEKPGVGGEKREKGGKMGGNFLQCFITFRCNTYHISRAPG